MIEGPSSIQSSLVVRAHTRNVEIKGKKAIVGLLVQSWTIGRVTIFTGKACKELGEGRYLGNS